MLDFENLHWLLLGRDADYLTPLLLLLRAVRHLRQLGHACRLPVTGQELSLLSLFHRFLRLDLIVLTCLWSLLCHLLDLGIDLLVLD